MGIEAFLLSELEFTLLNAFQRDFPLRTRPFANIAKRIGTDEATVIGTLQRLRSRGMITRVGPVFKANTIGASALAAISAAPERLEEVAARINAFAEVNHNYEREHRFNLWFVVTTPSAQRLQEVLRDIEAACDSGPVLALPMEREYHIDLGFDLASTAGTRSADKPIHAPRAGITLTGAEQALVAALQSGLPLVARPFAALGVPEMDALSTVARWLDDGVIKRFGVIVRHHELGYTANAMSVWDVPDEMVDAIGERIAASGDITLCYRRRRHLPEWRYNLFCMVHGKDRDDVMARVEKIAASSGLDAYPHDVLFSRRRFKQTGAHYAAAEVKHG
ncbi:MAG TPA: Lrp/AsnC family transcriptional regulator [Noviherbaspirillum sp.]